MARVNHVYPCDGYFGIGVLHSQDETNIGTLWRSAYIFGASFIFTIDKKYKKQKTDTVTAWSKIPLYQYDDFDSFYLNMPFSCKLIGVEIDDSAKDIINYKHAKRSIYLLGNESIGLGKSILEKCHDVIYLPGSYSLNLSVAGSIVMYDRFSKIGGMLPKP